MTDTVVIGIGRRERGDDGVGPAVLERMAALRVDADLVHARPDPGDLARAMSGRRHVVIVDAGHFGGTSGDIRTFDISRTCPSEQTRAQHGMGLLDALALVRSFHGFPANCGLIVVEAGRFGHGAGLSPAVTAAVETLAVRLARELEPAIPSLRE